MPTRAIPEFSAVKTSFRFGSLPLHQAKLPHNSATPSCGKVARKKTTHLAPNIRTPNLEKPVIKRNVVFLQSLAADRQKRAVAVILSGFDSDGAAALKPIKDAGGIVIAQSFQTAQQPDMPQSAVKTGCVDFLLSPAEIAAEIRRIGEERARSHDGGPQ